MDFRKRAADQGIAEEDALKKGMEAKSLELLGKEASFTRSLDWGIMQPMSDGLVLDLSCLCDMHPRLPGDLAAIMAIRAAFGLQRNKHSAGVNLHMAIENAISACALTWPAADLRLAKQHDHNRITEDGAEAIALAVAHKTKTWRVVRRMQREEHADWLLEHDSDGKRKLVAFEVSGVDQGSIMVRMREKLAQVAKNSDVDHRCAGVVGFERPEASLRSVKGKSYGR